MTREEFDKHLLASEERLDCFCKWRYERYYSRDITQDVLLIAISQYEKWNPEACELSTYLISIARNRYKIMAKRDAIHKRFVEANNILDDGHEMFIDHDLKLVEAVLEKRTRHQKRVIRDLLIGTKNNEMAKKYNLSPTTMKSYVCTVRKLLKNKLAEMME